MKHWPLTALHLDYHLPELAFPGFAGFDFATYLERLLESDAEMLTLFAKDHFGNAFYNTEIGHRHRNLPFDLLARTVPELKARGKKVYAYYSLCWEKYILDQHPEYRQLRSDGTPAMSGCWGAACVNSGYLEELVLPQLRELAARYPIDGIFIDIAMLQPDSCYCPACAAAFRARYGVALRPGGMTRDFNADSMANALRKIKQAIAPLELCANASWGMGQPAELDDITDYAVVESQPAHLASGGFLLQMIQAKYCHALQRPFQIITVRFNGGGWGELSLKPVEQLHFEFAMIAMHGGLISCGDQGDYDGMVEADAHRLLQNAFAFIRRRAAWLGGRARRDIAVLYSHASHFPISADLPPETPGIAKILTELDMQYEFCSPAALRANLAGYRLVIVPEGDAPDAATEAMLHTFLTNGGIVYREPATAAPEDGAAAHCYFDTAEGMLLIQAKLKQLPERPAAVTHCDAFAPIAPFDPATAPWRSPYTPADAQRPRPGVRFTRCGRGMLIETAAALSSAAWRSGNTRVRDLFATLLAAAHFASPFRISRSNIIGNLVDDGSKQYLHLLHYLPRCNAGTGYPAIDRCEPIDCEVELTVAAPPAAVTLQPDNRPLPFHCDGGRLHVAVTMTEVHHIVVVE